MAKQLQHFGVLGMHWGRRKGTSLTDSSNQTSTRNSAGMIIRSQRKETLGGGRSGPNFTDQEKGQLTLKTLISAGKKQHAYDVQKYKEQDAKILASISKNAKAAKDFVSGLKDKTVAGLEKVYSMDSPNNAGKLGFKGKDGWKKNLVMDLGLVTLALSAIYVGNKKGYW